MILRTQKEIVDRIEFEISHNTADFDNNIGVYLHTLDEKHVRQFVNPIFFLENDSYIDFPTPDTFEDLERKAIGLVQDWKRYVLQSNEPMGIFALKKIRAYKWLLSHPDADSFPGSLRSDYPAGVNTRDAYNYINAQISINNAWEKLSNATRDKIFDLKLQQAAAVVIQYPELSPNWRMEHVCQRNEIEYRLIENTKKVVMMSNQEDGDDIEGIETLWDMYVNGKFHSTYSNPQLAFDELNSVNVDTDTDTDTVTL